MVYIVERYFDGDETVKVFRQVSNEGTNELNTFDDIPEE